jgi:ATP-binding cassette, subfamily C (CFTR/MRP), member 1
MDDVLKDISFDLFKNQRVGIIGRTGAGKSTLTLAVSKIISISGGLMTIDGIDSQELDLKSLREKISVIPQDAFLYDGSLRLNLDPNK